MGPVKFWCPCLAQSAASSPYTAGADPLDQNRRAPRLAVFLMKTIADAIARNIRRRASRTSVHVDSTRARAYAKGKAFENNPKRTNQWRLKALKTYPSNPPINYHRQPRAPDPYEKLAIFLKNSTERSREAFLFARTRTGVAGWGHYLNHYPHCPQTNTTTTPHRQDPQTKSPTSAIHAIGRLTGLYELAS